MSGARRGHSGGRFLLKNADPILPPNTDDEMVHKQPSLVRASEHWRSAKWAILEPKTFEAARACKLHGYPGAVSFVDHAVGVILDYLRLSGLAEDAVEIYGSGHSDFACEHGIVERAPEIGGDPITRTTFIARKARQVLCVGTQDAISFATFAAKLSE